LAAIYQPDAFYDRCEALVRDLRNRPRALALSQSADHVRPHPDRGRPPLCRAGCATSACSSSRSGGRTPSRRRCRSRCRAST
jgi:hypothetical protein